LGGIYTDIPAVATPLPHKCIYQISSKSDPSNGLSRGHECDRRQTDHATEKCVGMGGPACAASATAPNNWNSAHL